jgi:hypothetical protein
LDPAVGLWDLVWVGQRNLRKGAIARLEAGRGGLATM